MIPLEKTQALVDMLMKHQEHCGELYQSENGEEVICRGCGARVVKREKDAVIEMEDHRIGIL